MSEVLIVQGERYHCGRMARLLRVPHHESLLRIGVPVHRELRAQFDRSFYQRAAFIDGNLCALWGAEGSFIGSTALVWLALSQYALKFPVTILRQAKREIAFLAQTKPELVTTVLPEDEAAHRLVMFLGFEMPDGFGGGPAFTRSVRDNILRYMRSNPDLMQRVGWGQQLSMIYRREWNRGR